MAKHSDDSPLSLRTSAAGALTAAERAVLDEALARGESLRKCMDEAIVDYGQWLFAHVFGGDTSAVFEHREESGLWNALVDASDGPRLRLTGALIERAVLCAAYDKRLNSDAWRALDYARKSRLVRLGEDKLLRAAAQHVLASNMSTVSVEKYVREVLRAEGESVQTRITLGRMSSQLARLTERFGDRAFISRLTAVVNAADDDERAAAMAQVEAAQKTLSALHAKLAKKAPKSAAKRRK